MLDTPVVQTTLAKLTLANAKRHRDIPLSDGHYMIGRHSECQIRPSSGSVSDRHCLLEHRSGVMRVFDLQSDAGTFLNGQKLSPHTWRFLKNGDSLKCGELEFIVELNSPPKPTTRSHEKPQRHSPSGAKPAKHSPVKHSPVKHSPVKNSPAKPVERIDLKKLAKTKSGAPKAKFASSRRRISVPRLTSLHVSNGESMKVVLAAALLLATIGVASLQFHSFSSAPHVRIVQEEY